PRRATRRLPRRRAQSLQERQAQEPDHAGAGGQPLAARHRGPHRVLLAPAGPRSQVLTFPRGAPAPRPCSNLDTPAAFTATHVGAIIFGTPFRIEERVPMNRIVHISLKV